MAHEFVAKNGLVVLGNEGVSGSLTVLGTITGNLTGTASFANSASSAGSSSYATYATSTNTNVTVSYANNAGSSSFSTRAITSSFGISAANADTSSFSTFAQSCSFAQSASNAISASWAPPVASASASYASFASSASFAQSASNAISASWAPPVASVSASFASSAISASYSLRSSAADSSSFASASITASWAPPYTASNILQWSLAGTPISFSLTNVLPSNAGFQAPLVINNSIMFYGGVDAAGAFTKSIWSASVNNPLVVSNTNATMPVSGSRFNPGTIQVIGNTIYFFGGDMTTGSAAPISASNFILTASVTTPHIVGKSNNFLPTRLSAQNLFNLNGTMYMVFGRTGSGAASAFTGSLYAPVTNPTSWSYGPDTTATTASMKCVWGQSIVIGDRMYVYGGFQITEPDASNHRVLTASVSNPLVWGIGASNLPAWVDSPQLINVGSCHFWMGGGTQTGSNAGLVYAFSASAPLTPINLGVLLQPLGGIPTCQGMATVMLPPIAFTGSNLITPIYMYGSLDDGGAGVLNGIYTTYASSNIVSSSLNCMYDYSNNQSWITEPCIPAPNELASMATLAAQANFLVANPPNINPPYQQGLMFWDTSSATWTFYNDSPQMSVNLGQETYFAAFNSQSTVQIPNGACVYVSGSTGGFPNVYLSRADSSGSNAKVDGVATTYISASTLGYVTRFGLVHGVNIPLAAGSALWVSQTQSGSYQATSPTLPYEGIQVGTLLSSGSNSTSIMFVNLPQGPGNATYSSSFATSAKTASYMQSLSGLVFSKGVTFFDPIGLAGTASLSQSILIWRAPFACTASAIWTNKMGGIIANQTASVNVRKNYATNLVSASINITSSQQYVQANTFVAGANFFSVGDTLDAILLTSSLFPQQVVVQIDITRQ